MRINPQVLINRALVVFYTSENKISIIILATKQKTLYCTLILNLLGPFHILEKRKEGGEGRDDSSPLQFLGRLMGKRRKRGRGRRRRERKREEL